MNNKHHAIFVAISLTLVSCTKEKPEETLNLHVASPEWQDQVIYFLMTDRFDDGDPSNNDQGVGEYDPSKESHYSGGDLKGVINRLDYLENLGVTAVWTTPIVANQWWSEFSHYGGYHGYWATDFSQIDAHLGDMDTFKQLSHELHNRDMYLIQDIVVNHTGNFFNYRNGHDGYNPENTAENFYFLEGPGALQTKPTQYPFDLIDRNNPEHVKANIYNWTPSITDYSRVDQQFTYQLASLADINTTNPVVIDAFKDIYGNWIEETGVDAFRIDTVRYVEHEFFHHFMHDEDGIHAIAKSTGRDNFLAFGEVFDTSKPYKNDAEKRVASYLVKDDIPILNSVISFPLHHDLKTVFGQGLPTEHLTYRIQQHMDHYPNPYIIPTFIDNHDMGRFLQSGDIDGLKQALAAILTLPGIPTIYQGTEQAMTESRQAMFKGGFNADKDYFDPTSEMYTFIAELTKLRTSDKLFTRGEFEVLASNANGPGLLAYKRRYQGREVLVMFNTSRHDILINQINVADNAVSLKPLWGEFASTNTDKTGHLTTQLPGRSIVIAEMLAVEDLEQNQIKQPTIDNEYQGQTLNSSISLSGTSSTANAKVLLVKNTRLDTAIEVISDELGKWVYDYPVVNLGNENVSIVAFEPATGLGSDALSFTTQVDAAQHKMNIIDAVGDDTGLTGKLSPPTHVQSVGQQDIVKVDAAIGGDVLQLTLTMKAVSDDWIPANGFDNVAFSVFFDIPTLNGGQELPLLNATMPDERDWDIGHVVYGWGNTTFSSDGATADHQGKKYGVAPMAQVNKEDKSITFTYRASDFGIPTWLGSHLYITTWDITGEGVYREISPEPEDWSFGGGREDDAKILDFVQLNLNAQSDS